MRKTTGVVLASLALVTGPALPAAADEPSWGTTRVMTCDGQSLSAQFTPGGPLTSFHVLGSNDVIVPKHLEILGAFQPGVWTTTVDSKGFSKGNAVATIHCTYTDPRGYPIRFDGIRR